MKLRILLTSIALCLGILDTSSFAKNFSEEIRSVQSTLNRTGYLDTDRFSDAVTGKGCGLSTTVVFTPETFAPLVALVRHFANKVINPNELKSKLLKKRSDPLVPNSPENSFLWYFLVRSLQEHVFIQEGELVVVGPNATRRFKDEIIKAAKENSLTHVTESYISGNIINFALLSGGKFFGNPKRPSSKTKEQEKKEKLVPGSSSSSLSASKRPTYAGDQEFPRLPGESDDEYAIRLSLAESQPHEQDLDLARALRMSQQETERRQKKEEEELQRVEEESRREFAAQERKRKEADQKKIQADRLVRQKQDRQYQEALALDRLRAEQLRKAEDEAAAEAARLAAIAKEESDKKAREAEEERQEKLRIAAAQPTKEELRLRRLAALNPTLQKQKPSAASVTGTQPTDKK